MTIIHFGGLEHAMKIGAIFSLVSLVTLAVVNSPLLYGRGQVLVSWKQSTVFPEPRAGYAAGVLVGKLVIAGGTYWEGTKGNWTRKIFSPSAHAFDAKNETWEKLPDAPFAFGYAASTVVGDKLFVLGGYTPDGINRRILTLTRQKNGYVWEVFGEMPADRLFAQAVSVGKKIYLLGGTTKFEPYDAAGTCCTSATATNNLMVLDTANPHTGWQQLAPYPGDRRWLFTAETDGNSIWMFGGTFQADQRDPTRNFDEVLRYEIKAGRWSVVGSLPSETREETTLSAMLMQRTIILINSTGKAWQFDLKTCLFQQLPPLPQAAYVDKFVRLDNVIVGAGGENSVEGPRKRSEWTFIGKLEPNSRN